eukprot:6189321-Lingulodinium_polyedra.AAC.1
MRRAGFRAAVLVFMRRLVWRARVLSGARASGGKRRAVVRRVGWGQACRCRRAGVPSPDALRVLFVFSGGRSVVS